MELGKLLQQELGQNGMANVAAVIAALAERARSVELLERPGAMPMALVPAGMALEEVPGLLDKPLRIIEATRTTEVPAFTAYVNRFKTEHSVVFLNRENATLTAALDYHGPNDPQFVSHKISLALKKDREWDAWKGIFNKGLTQLQFAEFIEDYMPNFIAPTGAAMLEMALKLKIDQKAQYTSAKNLANGDTTLVYSVENITREMTIPNEIQISVPVFYGSNPSTLRARLRYRLSEGTVQFTVKPNRDDLVYDQALENAISEVIEATGLLVIPN